MPIGGIGTGTISLAGRGALVDWEIRNRPAKGYTPVSSKVAPCFLIRTETSEGQVEARILEGPLDTECYEGESGGWGLNHGFPRFSGCRFHVAYPLAQVELLDETVPVSVTLEAMNPLVPNDADASGIPAALLRWRLANRQRKPVRVSICGVMVNPCGGEHERRLLDAKGLKGVCFKSKDCGSCDDTAGEFAFAVESSAGTVTRATAVADRGWMIGFDPFWRKFVANGRVAEPGDVKSKTRPLAAVSVELTLGAGAEIRVPFFVSWRFPHRRAWTDVNQRDSGRFDAKFDVGNRYAVRFPSAQAAMEGLKGGLSGHEAATIRFVRGVLSAKAPAVVKEAALFNLSTLRSTTCFRTNDGHFFGWEGSFDREGSCFGNCTHVWGYEHALIDIWPSLAKDMTELQFGPASSESGRMDFRISLPLLKASRFEHDAADGHSQCIVKAYENWRKTGDDVWMKGLYPKIRRSMEFCWIEGGWDADCDGVMEGSQHNTMDVNYYGPNPQMEFLYLAALKAMATMADATGDCDFAEKCRDLAKRGAEWTEANLFNGEYYEHKVVSPSKVAKGLQGEPNLKVPKFQLAAGCLVDQLVGDYAARAVGLDPVADERNAAKSLDAVLRHNRGSRGRSVFNLMRTFAFPEERSIAMAWYPKGRMPENPFPYYNETMTGFEYVVAAALAQRGRYAEAEEVVRDIRSRYDGRKRNPFDEAECGHHYVRALTAWSVLKAFEEVDEGAGK